MGFVAGVVDELYGLESIQNAPKKSCFASLTAGQHKATWDYYTNSWPVILSSGIDVSPGDIILCANPSGTGHIYIAGPRANTFWHTVPNGGVQIAGVGDIKNVQHLFKMLNKQDWLNHG